MGKYLSQQQIDQFHEAGFLSPIDVISETEALAFHSRLEEVEERYPIELNPENRNNLHLTFTLFDELAHHPIVLDAVEDLIGPDFSLWASVLFAKEAASKQFVSWHQDATYMGIEPHHFVTPWIALTPSNLENGCMSMIPGSHREVIEPHQDTYAEDNVLTRGQAIAGVDESKAEHLILKPGQMSIHHAKIIHGSQPNHSAHRRIGFALQSFLPADAQQTVGEAYCLSVRGNVETTNLKPLHRPRFDMDPNSIAERDKANQNLANILYRGASQKRAY